MARSYGEPLAAHEVAAFVAAVEASSVHGAAEALQLTQSAATKRIRSLERRLGTVLLERGRFGVRPTDAGRLLYPEAKNALGALERAAAVVATHSGQATPLRFASSYTVGELLLPGWLAAFRATEAGPVRAQVEIANSQTVLASVRDGHVDIGFIESFDSTHGLQTLTILDDEIVVVVAAAHPWARRKRLVAKDLVGQPYLAREQGSGTRAVAAAALASAGIELEATLETASTQSLKRAVEDGGFTLISRRAIEVEEQAGSLRALPVSDVDLTRPLRAVRRRRPGAVGGPKRFWRWLETSVADAEAASS